MNKSAALLCIIILTASSLTMVGSAFAQSIPKPSVPEFTVQFVSSPPESHSVNTTIELSIKNQPFVSNYGFFYNVRMRVNNGNWSLLYTIDDVPTQSNGDYTTLSYPSDQPVVEYQYNLGDRIQDLFAGDKIDFQVQAMIGTISRVFNPNFTSQLDMYPYVFIGESSDWSNTQTITIPSSNPSTTSSPSPTLTPNGEPQQTELLEIFLAVALTVAVIGAGILVYFKKRNHARINKHGEIEQSST